MYGSLMEKGTGFVYGAPATQELSEVEHVKAADVTSSKTKAPESTSETPKKRKREIPVGELSPIAPSPSSAINTPKAAQNPDGVEDESKKKKKKKRKLQPEAGK
jgi:hypothetical protein